MARLSSLTLLLSTLALLAFSPIGLTASECTYRKDSLGNTRYQCQDGRHGTLRTDSLGTVKDWAVAPPGVKTRWATSGVVMAPPTGKTASAMCALATARVA